MNERAPVNTTPNHAAQIPEAASFKDQLLAIEGLPTRDQLAQWQDVAAGLRPIEVEGRATTYRGADGRMVSTELATTVLERADEATYLLDDSESLALQQIASAKSHGDLPEGISRDWNLGADAHLKQLKAEANARLSLNQELRDEKRDAARANQATHHKKREAILDDKIDVELKSTGKEAYDKELEKQLADIDAKVADVEGGALGRHYARNQAQGEARKAAEQAKKAAMESRQEEVETYANGADPRAVIDRLKVEEKVAAEKAAFKKRIHGEPKVEKTDVKDVPEFATLEWDGNGRYADWLAMDPAQRKEHLASAPEPTPIPTPEPAPAAKPAPAASAARKRGLEDRLLAVKTEEKRQREEDWASQRNIAAGKFVELTLAKTKRSDRKAHAEEVKNARDGLATLIVEQAIKEKWSDERLEEEMGVMDNLIAYHKQNQQEAAGKPSRREKAGDVAIAAPLAVMNFVGNRWASVKEYYGHEEKGKRRLGVTGVAVAIGAVGVGVYLAKFGFALPGSKGNQEVVLNTPNSGKGGDPANSGIVVKAPTGGNTTSTTVAANAAPAAPKGPEAQINYVTEALGAHAPGQRADTISDHARQYLVAKGNANPSITEVNEMSKLIIDHNQIADPSKLPVGFTFEVPAL